MFKKMKELETSMRKEEVKMERIECVLPVLRPADGYTYGVGNNDVGGVYARY